MCVYFSGFVFELSKRALTPQCAPRVDASVPFVSTAMTMTAGATTTTAGAMLRAPQQPTSRTRGRLTTMTTKSAALTVMGTHGRRSTAGNGVVRPGCGRRRGEMTRVRGTEHELDEAYAGGSATRMKKTLELQIGESTVTLETGAIGLQANGAVMAREGETIVYTTACASRDRTGDGSFVPLTVNYQERFSAAGKTAGGYKKRDGGLRENETLKARLVDRPIRPMMYKGWGYETQVLQWLMSFDAERSTDALAITAASAALAVSNIPLKKPVCGVRVGLMPGSNEPIVNPTSEQMKESRLDLVLAGTDDAVLMIEGFCDFLTTDEMLRAIEKGHQAVSKACKEIEAWAAEVAPPKMMDKLIVPPEGVDEAVEALVGEELAAAIVIPIKQERGATIGAARERAVEALKEQFEVRALFSFSRWYSHELDFAFFSSFFALYRFAATASLEKLLVAAQLRAHTLT
jgi:polyribonucleotide nucleotidyltransferase